ncbi:MAG: SRPBCC domain-containing protein [Acetobacteraceae bacterium]
MLPPATRHRRRNQAGIPLIGLFRFAQPPLTSTFDAIYHDVIPNERLVYSYEMHLDDRKISVSLATMQLRAERKGTRLLIDEQGAFFDGFDDAGAREQGTGELLDALGRSLSR